MKIALLTTLLSIAEVTLAAPKSGCLTKDGPAMVGPDGTEAKPSVGKQCVFPFKVNGVEYNSCTTTYQEEHKDSCSAFEDHADLRPICSTLVDKDGNHVAVHPSSPQNWGYCGDECPLSGCEECGKGADCNIILVPTSAGRNTTQVFCTCPHGFVGNPYNECKPKIVACEKCGSGAECCQKDKESNEGWCYCPLYTTGKPYEQCEQELQTFGAGALLFFGWMLG